MEGKVVVRVWKYTCKSGENLNSA